MRQIEIASPASARQPDPAAGRADERPVLWLGISGFSPQQRAVLDAFLVRPPSLPQWRTCSFSDADALLVNGGKVTVMADGSLRVAAGLPNERALNLNPNEMDRPIAFSTPLPSSGFEPRCAFDASSLASVHGVLLQFDRWMQLVRSQFVIGSRIVHDGERLRGGVFHLNHGGALLAVLDFRQGNGAVSPAAHPADLLKARWDRRPLGASDTPPGFLAVTPSQFAWSYVRRTERDLLPPRYATETIYFRRAPKVPLRWLRDSQLLLLRELAAEPATLEGLRGRTSLPVSHLRHDLACMYYAGSVTTTPAKARAPAGRQRVSEAFSSDPPVDSLQMAQLAPDLTAPAVLVYKAGAAGDQENR